LDDLQFTSSYQKAHAINKNLPRLARETAWLDIADQAAKNSGFQTERWDVSVPAKLSVFAKSLSINIPGKSTRRLAFLLPLHSAPGDSADPALAPAAALSLIHTYSLDQPSFTVEIVLLAGQFGDDLYDGLETWLWRSQGILPDALVVADPLSFPSALELSWIQGNTGFTAHDLSSTMQKARAFLPVTVAGTEFLGGRIVSKPHPGLSPLDHAGIPTLIIHESSGQSKSTAAYADFLSACASQTMFADIFNKRSGTHFLYLPTHNPIILDEKPYLLALSTFALLWIIATWMLRRRVKVSVLEFRQEFHRYLLLFMATLFSAGIAWLLATGLGGLLNARQVWDDHPSIGIFAEFLIGAVVFVALYSLGLSKSLPGKPAGYVVAAHISSIAIILVFSLRDVSLAWPLLPLLVLSLPVGVHRYPHLLMARILASFLVLVCTFVLYSSGSIGTSLARHIRDDALFSIGGLGLVWFHLGTFFLARISQRRHPQYSARRFFIRRLFLGLSIVIFVVYFCGLFLLPERNPHLFVTYSESPDLGFATLNTRQDYRNGEALVKLGQTLLNAGTANQTTQTVPLLPVKLEVKTKAEPFLSRKTVNITINHQITTRDMTLDLDSPNELQVLSASLPYNYRDLRHVSFLVGPYPPETFTVRIELPVEAVGKLKLSWTENARNDLEVKTTKPVQTVFLAHFERSLTDLP